MTTKASLPDKIGRYQILERVGKGGMGVLYRGHDPVLPRGIAHMISHTRRWNSLPSTSSGRSNFVSGSSR